MWGHIRINVSEVLNKRREENKVASCTQSGNLNGMCDSDSVRDRAPGPFYGMLGQTHVNGRSRVIASQNGDSTSYIFPLRLGVLQWSRHLFNYLDK